MTVKSEKVFWQTPERVQNKFATEFVRSLRGIFAQRIIEAEHSECPQVNSLEELLQLAQKETTSFWQQEIQPLLREFLNLWAETLTAPKEQYYQQALKNSAHLDQQLAIKYFTDLEGLRDLNPEVWKVLVNLSMLRQDQEIALLNCWTKKMTDKDFERLQVNANQLTIALAISAEIGPLVNQIYLKQIDLGFLDDVKLKENDKKILGAATVYEVLIGPKNSVLRIPYSSMFTETWDKIAKKYRLIAELTRKLCPEDGQEFANYLMTIAAAYTNPTTNFRQLQKIWTEIEKLQYKLSNSNWPINLIAAGSADVSRHFNKTDANLIVGLKTPDSTALEKIFNKKYLSAAREILAKHQPTKTHQLKNISLNFLLAAAGSGTWWRNQGEADGRAFCYTNAVKEVSELAVLGNYQKLFQEINSEQEKAELLEIMLISVALHELGHTMQSMENTQIAKRVGYYDDHAELIDELKADTTGIRIFWEVEKKQIKETDRAYKFLQLIIAYCHDYITTDGKGKEKIGTYATMAMIMLQTMMQAGGIQKNGDHYQILSVEKSFDSLCQLSAQILDQYADSNMTPAQMAKFTDDLTKAAQREFNRANV